MSSKFAASVIELGVGGVEAGDVGAGPSRLLAARLAGRHTAASYRFGRPASGRTSFMVSMYERESVRAVFQKSIKASHDSLGIVSTALLAAVNMYK